MPGGIRIYAGGHQLTTGPGVVVCHLGMCATQRAPGMVVQKRAPDSSPAGITVLTSPALAPYAPVL